MTTAFHAIALTRGETLHIGAVCTETRPVEPWRARAAYAAGAIVEAPLPELDPATPPAIARLVEEHRANTHDGPLFARALNEGTSGDERPAFPHSPGLTAQDGGVTWAMQATAEVPIDTTDTVARLVLTFDDGTTRDLDAEAIAQGPAGHVTATLDAALVNSLIAAGGASFALLVGGDTLVSGTLR